MDAEYAALMQNQTWKLVPLPQGREAVDIIITGNSNEAISQVIKQLNDKFALKDMGELHYFFGIQATKTANGGLLLSQEKYTRDLLKKAEMEHCKPCHTPLPSLVRFSAFGSSPFKNSKLYRSVVGSLQYLTVTRPELAYSVYAKSLGRALEVSRKNSEVQTIKAYSDSDWAEDPDDRKFTGGFCVFLESNLVS
ncbi:uncharacterized protein LOC107615476 [Arachis ipaensis]|uniref:uncharacterized protein LOC107615476 n=1 Tax=Arachis ipaensis TaxID=130454 RepID=UPI0007AF563B|nr:uncharacterized protein LOC107615476 [Arachis ipaensis]